MTQLRDLVRPFPADLIHQNPSGFGSYVAHPVITQRLLLHLGPFDWQLVEVIRGDTKDDLVDVVVGVVYRLTVTVDSRATTVESVGDCENPGNWPHDGARLKDAESDALKRCAMRLGLGLQLWAKPDEWFLGERLDEQVQSRPFDEDDK